MARLIYLVIIKYKTLWFEMDAYHKVPKEKDDTAENEIRVAVAGSVSSYLGYAFRILNKSDYETLTIRATGNAIVKALILVELVKRRIGNLHQLNKIHSMTIIDVFQPKIEGLEPLEQPRRVTALDCILSKDAMDPNQVGYQEPEPKEDRPPHSPTKKQNKDRDRSDDRDPENKPSDDASNEYSLDSDLADDIEEINDTPMVLPAAKKSNSTVKPKGRGSGRRLSEDEETPKASGNKGRGGDKTE